MEYNIYCDESCHLEHDGIKPMAIGAVWCPKEAKDIIFTRLREIKVEHGLKPHCELKWNAVSQSKLAYYKDVMNYFFDNQDLHFRVLLVRDKSVLDHAAYHQSHDSFYYKMYFDMLKNIIEPTSSYNIYLDIKDTRGQDKVNRLLEYLRTTKYDFDRNVVREIQQVRSHEVELVTLADFLIGAVTYAHRGLTTSYAKLELIEMFKRDFVTTRPIFEGKPLALKKFPLVAGREYTFYHLTQEGEDEDNRQFSIDRAECIPFPRPMIDNISHPYLVWSNTRNGKERILVYHEQESYLVILEKRDGYALLWTAYPISREHTYRKLMKEYEAYKKARTVE